MYPPRPLVTDIKVRSSESFQLTKERGGIFGYLFLLEVPPLFATCLNFAQWKGFICINVTHILFSSHNLSHAFGGAVEENGEQFSRIPP